ncbi:MAG: beta-1,6-N-acetylglucosaminyltransferase [Pseudomonadota bacterium]
MSLAVIMLVHTALDRAEQVARHWSTAGCPVVIHVDKKVPRPLFETFRKRLEDVEDVSFCARFRCEWGTWGIVAATQAASEMLLHNHPHVNHIYLASGACLPLRPVEELVEYLSERPRTDFIESATTADVPWTMGGLDSERFSLRFPFAWKKKRFLFDRFVQLQRLLRVERQVPRGLVPHMGSQWWCLTRKTLAAILQDPDRRVFDRYFSRVWIPDESYFQTMARQYATKIESRSLTLSKFDFQGKPHIFYDDHLQLLRRSDCFVARKIWPQANALFRAFLTDPTSAMSKTEPNPAKIDRIFAKAVDRRVRGRPGLYMQSRFPERDIENTPTAAPYTMFQGFAELFEDFEPWLAKTTGARVHGHIFAPDRAHFADGERTINGALSDSAHLRDYNPRAFLTNFLWNTRGDYQCFQFGPADNQVINWDIAKDANAHIWVISGAWAVPLYHATEDFSVLRREAARLQKIESHHLKVLRSSWVKARVNIWTMAEFVEAPMEPLQAIVDRLGTAAPRRLTEAPRMAELTRFGEFLQNLKNQGMHPYLMGDFPVTAGQPSMPPRTRPRPYLVR